MDVTYQLSQGRLLFKVNGEMTMFTVSAFNEAFATATEQSDVYDIVIDCAGVTLMDSCGLGALVAALKHSQNHGGFIHLVALRAGILEILYMTKLERRFRLFKTLDEAMNAPAPLPFELSPAPAA